MSRKLISCLLMLALALSLTAPGATLTAKAVGTVPVTVSSASGKPGDTVVVSVSFGVSEEMPVRNAQFKLRYDVEKLTLVSTEYTNQTPTGLRLTNTDTPGNVNWGWAAMEPYTTGGNWMNITFRINENASGTAAFTLYDTMCAEDSETENYQIQSTVGTVTIQQTSTGGSGGVSGGAPSSGGPGGAATTPAGDKDDSTDVQESDTAPGSSTPESSSVQKVKKIKFTKQKKKIKVHKTYQFKAKTVGKKAAIKWLVSNKKIATIDKKTGKFRAKKPGVVVVTAKAGGVSAKVKVRVVK